MTTIQTFMAEDHRRCDDLLAKAEEAMAKNDTAAALAAFEDFRVATLAHFESEERTLFPTFEAKTGMTMGPTQVMRMEHEQMRGLLDAAAQALTAGDADGYLGHTETLLIMMQQHNLKEENVLYPMIDSHLSAEAPELLQRLEAELTHS